jgi:protein SCO1/2
VKKRLTAAALLLACASAAVTLYLLREPHADHHGSHGAHSAHEGMAALAQTLLPVDGGEPVAAAALIAADGEPFAPERLKGRWSLVFFGFTSCPDVCPVTLQLLSVVARDPAGGVPAGATQIVFVTVDPQIDTPERLKGYLAHFDERIVGLTGSKQALDRFAAGLGAASEPSGSGGIDHSTSIFALDPQGRLAGIMLRPADPARIVADLNVLRAVPVAAASQAHGSHTH